MLSCCKYFSDLSFIASGGTSDKESTCQRRRRKRCGFDPWVWKITGGGNGNPPRYSCQEETMDRGAH